MKEAVMTSSEGETGNRVLTGKCECGAVRYAVPDAFLYAANCHFTNCRAGTGSAFKAFAGIERAKLEITEGHDQLLVFGSKAARFEITDDLPQHDGYAT